MVNYKQLGRQEPERTLSSSSTHSWKPPLEALAGGWHATMGALRRGWGFLLVMVVGLPVAAKSVDAIQTEASRTIGVPFAVSMGALLLWIPFVQLVRLTVSRAEERLGLKSAWVRVGRESVWGGVTGLIVLFVSGLGLLLFVVPGIVVFARLSLALCFMLRDQLAPLESLRMSFRVTRGRTFDIWRVIAATALTTAACLVASVAALALILGIGQPPPAGVTVISWLYSVVMAGLLTVALVWTQASLASMGFSHPS